LPLIGLGLITAVFGQYILFLLGNKANLGKLTLTGTLFVVSLYLIKIFVIAYNPFDTSNLHSILDRSQTHPNSLAIVVLVTCCVPYFSKSSYPSRLYHPRI